MSQQSPPPGWGDGPPPGYGQQPPPGWSGPPPGYPPYGYYAPQTEGKAIGALVAAIIAFVFCPLIPAIVALVLAGQAEQSIRASGGRLTGDGLVTAARWISWIHLGLCALGLLLFLAFFATAASYS